MRILLIKTSSMGDLIHTLPALTDAGRAMPGITFDWVVEDVFQEIPHWHPLVSKTIPVALRRWRKGLFSSATREGWKQLQVALRADHYDLILDAQGLVKSAFLTFLAQGLRAGLDWGSAREAFASLAYQRKYTVNFKQHAIVRMRSLFSQALGYDLPVTEPDFGLHTASFPALKSHEKYVVFLHGTTWATKQWPEDYWLQLAALVAAAGYRIKISGGNQNEVARAERIAKCPAAQGCVDVLPMLTLSQMAALLANAKAVVAVDTGFGHLAAALNIPTLSLYGATSVEYTSAQGKSSLHLAADFPCAPCLSRTCTYRERRAVTPACYTTLAPVRVWAAVQQIMR